MIIKLLKETINRDPFYYIEIDGEKRAIFTNIDDANRIYDILTKPLVKVLETLKSTEI